MDSTLRNDLLSDIFQALLDLDRGAVPSTLVEMATSTDLRHLYVHFFDDEDSDIGNLGLPKAIDALWNDIFLWPDCSTEEDEYGEPAADLNLQDAVSIVLRSH